MAVITSPYMSVKFDETTSTPKLIVTDTQDYSSTSIVSTDVRIYLKVSLVTASGSVVVYDNLAGTTPDIDRSVSAVSTSLIKLPVDANGATLLGDYTVDMQKKSNTSAFAPFSQSHTFSYVEPAPEMKLAIVVDCANSKVTSKDITDYGNNYTSISRVHKLYPPAQLGMPPFTNALAILTVSGIYTSTWTAEVVTTYTYSSPQGYSFTRTVSAIREFTVDCDTNLCAILCCLANVKKSYDHFVNSNPTQAQIYRQTIIEPAFNSLSMFQAAQMCGDVNKMALYKNEILDITGCGTECNCGTTNDNAVQVIPTTGVDLISVVDSPDNSVSVTTEVVGNTTIYHLSVSSAIQTIVNGMYNTTVSTATPAYLSVTPSGTNPKNYKVDFIGNIPTLPEQIEIQLLLMVNPDYPTSPAYAVVNPFYIMQNGSNWKPQLNHSWVVGTSAPNDDTQLAVITLSNILTPSSFTYLNAHAQLMKTKTSVLTVDTPYFLEIFSQDNTGTGSITLRFVDELGIPVTLKTVLKGLYGALISLSLYNS